MPARIDVNADLGESFGPWTMGDDEAMLSGVTSANVACGGHAGDHETMFRSCELAVDNGVVVGAQPGYLDPAGFGRRIIPMAPAEITRMVAVQVGALMGAAALAGSVVRYVKAHGALGNLAARDRGVAAAVAEAVAAFDPGLAVLAISGTAMEDVAREAGLDTYSEIFADRGYRSDGQLVPRDQPGALLHDPGEALDRLLGFVETGAMPTVDGGSIPLRAHSVCVHGDSPGAVDMARVVRAGLAESGIAIRSFLEP